MKLTVPAYQQLLLNSEGYPVSDVEVKYNIEPTTYQFSPANVGLGIFERSATGSETFMGFVPADSNKKIILSKGMAKFDSNYTYYAQVVLNRGPREIRSEKIPLINAALIPDYDRNGVIDDADRGRAQTGDKFYFWINDDDDAGETDGSDIPEDKMLMSIKLDYEDGKVDGVRDLIDFFPVHLDIRSLLYAFDPAKFAYKLISEDESLNFVITDIEALHAGYYLRGDDDNLKIPYDLGNADTKRIQAVGSFLDNAFLNKIKTGSKGIVLIEGRKISTKPLELKIYDNNQNNVWTLSLNLSLSGVEQMFRHKNLTIEIKNSAVLGPGSKDGEVSRPDASNCPDVECLGADPQKLKNFVYIHGYGNNGQEARGRQVETFKRMFWSGSKAKFYGVTWYGWDSQLGPVTPNFHINVEHAFATVPALKNFIYNDVAGEVTIAAHSLGNMLVSAMLSDDTAGWDASKKIKSFFMLDAAVAAEAYGSDDDNTYPELIEAGTHPDMTHPSWQDYERRLWASEWHLLFDDTDNRKKLTWRNIFKNRPASVTYYNFYSSGEEVLDKHEGELNVVDIIKQWKQTGIYTWALQEKLKGKAPVDGILGSDYGGWGFNLDDQEYYFWGVAGDPPVAAKLPIFPENAATLKSQQLRIRPFFSIGSEADLYKEETGSNYAAQHKIRLLADAIPARTLAAGKKEVLKLGDIDKFNFDMQTSLKTTKKVNDKYVVYWPSSRGKIENWWHGDAREVAYSYVYSLFDKFVGLGGLK